MVFSSINFLLIFFPIFFTCYYLTPNKYKNYTLLLGSLAFYFIGTLNAPYHFVLLIACMLVDFFAGLGISRSEKHKKLLLVLGIIFHLICLCTFKYASFIIGELGKLSDSFNITVNIILPIGISFYTFQTMSYTIDVYRRTAKVQKNIINLAAYVTMFPQLIAGPIVRYQDVADQLEYREGTAERFAQGVSRFCIGLGKKVLLANNIGALWDTVKVMEHPTVLSAWLGALAFMFQI